jgi:cytochrome c-type biogenesis protein CcmH/NrfG
MRTGHIIAWVASMAVATGLTCLALGASAGDTKPAAAKDGGSPDDKYDPENRTHISKFMEAAVEGNKKLVSRDFPAAIEAYRKAIQLQPTNPLGHYLLGEAQSASGNLPEAEASWSQADNLGDKDPQVKVRVLFCLADLKERQKKWDDAKAGWQRYQQFITNHPGSGGFVTSAEARITAIDEAMKQDKAYDIVRQRIAAEKDGGK